jgi:formylglycine-generating enzyme required for sulfatase activity
MLRASIFVALLALFASHARAESRIALLIGNEAYTSEIGWLANPHNDVALLEQALKGLGFEVVTVRDAGLGALTRAVNAYARRLQAAGPNAIGLFYYSGHGASDGNTNYLIPVDVKTTETGELWDQSLQLNEITRKLKRDAGNATHFVVFDACRNTLKLTQPGSRAVVQSKGFVPVAQENGMLIAYATAEGELASDVGAGAGPYAKVLAEEIVKPGIEAVVMFRAVQRRVRAAIKQEPYLGFNALGDVYLAGKSTKPPEPAPTQARLSEAAEAWDRTKDTTNIAVLEAFIARFKETFLAELARARIDELKRQQVAVVVSPKAPKAAPQAKPAMTAPPTPPQARCDGVEAQVGNETRCLKPKDNFKDCNTCPEMVVVPAGEFTMGSPGSEPGQENWWKRESPAHQVIISKPFAVGRFAITRGEYAVFVRETNHTAGNTCRTLKDGDWDWHTGRSFRNPGFIQDDRHPVVCVNWNDANAFAAWLSKKSGKSYRLLSEAEREYATRAGTTTRYSFGDDARALCRHGNLWDQTTNRIVKINTRTDVVFLLVKHTTADCDDGYAYTAPVGQFAANAFGIYDVHGNVSDWTADCWHDSYQGAPTDGSAWTSGDCSERVTRGGSWSGSPMDLRSADRGRGSTADYDDNRGFRVARTLSP